MKHFNKKVYTESKTWLVACDVDSSIAVNGLFIYTVKPGTKKVKLFKLIDTSTGKVMDSHLKPKAGTLMLSTGTGLPKGGTTDEIKTVCPYPLEMKAEYVFDGYCRGSKRHYFADNEIKGVTLKSSKPIVSELEHPTTLNDVHTRPVLKHRGVQD
ncbi:hypothetical protein ABN214_14810 [Proteus terrae]|uniref:hypothetical protein n=1 Tax=Proteus terrae TaxID=1574161 RepID=UPI0032D9B575